MEVGKSIVWNNETLIIRKYDAQKDQEKVLKLWKAAFNNQMPASLWHWKYIDNPYEIAILICENSKGEPVVFYGGIPFLATYCGRKIQMIHLSDIMSDPNYRGSGLFIHTANAYFDIFGTMDDLFIMYGFPGKYHFDIGEKYLRYSHLGHGVAFLKADIKKVKRYKRLISGTVEMCNAPDDCFDHIWEHIVSDYPLSIIRDSAYIAWRYLYHPEKKYEVWRYRTCLHKDWQAFLVLQIKEEKAVIVDILVPDSIKLFCDFLGNIAKILLERGIQDIETWVPDAHFLAVFFSSCGFEKNRDPLGIIPTIRLFDERLNVDWACQNFYYNMGDGDLF